MRDYCTTYWRLIDRFKKNPGGAEKHHIYPRWLGHDNEEVVFVNQTQHACLHYLIWLEHPTHSAASAFIAAASGWRRGVYNCSKVSKKLISAVSSVNLTEVRRNRPRHFNVEGGKKAGSENVSNQRGIFSPDWTYEHRLASGRKGVEKQLAAGKPARAMTWIITDDKGNEFIVYNRAEYLRSIGLRHPKQLKQIGYKSRPVN